MHDYALLIRSRLRSQLHAGMATVVLSTAQLQATPAWHAAE